MEDDAATVAGRSQETGKTVGASQLQLRDLLRDVSEGPGPDLEEHLPGLAILRHLRFVLQAQIEGRQTGRGIAQRSALLQSCGQHQTVQADAP